MSNVNLNREHIATLQDMVAGKFNDNVLERVAPLAAVVKELKDDNENAASLYEQCKLFAKKYNEEFKPGLTGVIESCRNMDELAQMFETKLRADELPKTDVSASTGTIAAW